MESLREFDRWGEAGVDCRNPNLSPNVTSLYAIDSGRTSATLKPADMFEALSMKPGDVVEVRSIGEIRATLDANNKLEGVMFMPEMVQHCGKRFRVLIRAETTCALSRYRVLHNTVHLDQARCDGSSHGGCQASCRLFWKEQWLRRIEDGEDINPFRCLDGGHVYTNDTGSADNSGHGWMNLCPALAVASKPAKMECQSSALFVATEPKEPGGFFSWLNRILRDACSGNVRPSDLGYLLAYLRGKIILLAFMRWASASWNLEKYRKTPIDELDLKPGEWVTVRSVMEILRTLDRRGRNRGMDFKPEMFLYCGRRFRVRSRVERLIDEISSELKHVRTACILLEDVHCHGQRSFCTRGNFHFWREIWLRRC